MLQDGALFNVCNMLPAFAFNCSSCALGDARPESPVLAIDPWGEISAPEPR